MIDIKTVKACDEYKQPKNFIHDTECMTKKANYALNLVARWGEAAHRNPGKLADSAYQQNNGLMPVKELVDRAIEATDLLFNKFEFMEWSVHVPTLSEMDQLIADAEKEKDDAS